MKKNMAPCRIEWVMIKILVSVVRLSIGFISLPFNFCSFVLIQKNQKIKAARKWLKSLFACLKEKNSPRVRGIPGLRQFFFFNDNPNGFFNAISMIPKKKPPTPTRKLLYLISSCQSCESCLIIATQNNMEPICFRNSC